MTRQTTCYLTVSALLVALAHAQEPIPIPIPDPVSTVVDDDALSISPSPGTNVSGEPTAVGDDGDRSAADSDPVSILVDSNKAPDSTPRTLAPEIEKPKTITSTDSLEPESTQPSDRMQNPRPAPAVKRSAQAIPPSRSDSRPAADRSRQRSVVQQRFPWTRRYPRSVTTTNAATAYDSANPSEARPATYERRFRRGRVPGEYRPVESAVVTRVSAFEGGAVPSRRLRRYRSGPAATAVTPLGGPRGPASQFPQPRPFVPRQPLRNFMRGIAP